MTLRGSALLLLFAVHSNAADGDDTWQHFRFTPTKLRGDDAELNNIVQVAEIELFYKNAKVNLAVQQATAVCADNAAANGNEGALKAIDGNVLTKWLSANCNQPGAPDNRVTTCSVTISAAPNPPGAAPGTGGIKADAFTFVTAKDDGDDELKRDPTQWTFEGCKTADITDACWVSLYKQTTDFATPTTRNPQTGGTELPQMKFSTNGKGGGGEKNPDDLDIQGCSGGCAFLIIFFCGGFVYFAAGFAINRFKFEKQGAEAIPNVEFWKDVPHLVKDGFRFVVRKAKGDTYSAV